MYVLIFPGTVRT